MKILRDFYRRLRSGEASESELPAMDRRAFLFGMAATASGLVVAPKIFLPPPDKSLAQWMAEMRATAREMGLLIKGDLDTTTLSEAVRGNWIEDIEVGGPGLMDEDTLLASTHPERWVSSPNYMTIGTDTNGDPYKVKVRMMPPEAGLTATSK